MNAYLEEEQKAVYSLSDEHAIDLVHKWREILLPDKRWVLTITVVRDQEQVSKKKYRERMGLSDIDNPYFAATIQFHDFNIHSEEEANYVACHEMIHVVFALAQNVIDDSLDTMPQTAATILENAVESMSRGLLALEKTAAKAVAELQTLTETKETRSSKK